MLLPGKQQRTYKGASQHSLGKHLPAVLSCSQPPQRPLTPQPSGSFPAAPQRLEGTVKHDVALLHEAPGPARSRGRRGAAQAGPALPCPPSPSPSGPRGPRLRSPVLAGRDDAVLLGDEERSAHHVLVPLDLAEQDGPAALRPRVDLGRHDAAGPAPSAEPRARRNAPCRAAAAR